MAGPAPRSKHAERGQQAAAPGGIGDGRIAPDEARRDGAPPDIKGDRHADGETEKKQDAERRVAPELLQGIAQDDPQRPQLPRNGLDHVHPETGAEDAVALLEQGAGEAGPAQVADLGVQLLGLHQQGAAEALGLVELRDGRLALGAVPGDVGAFLGLAFLGLRSELAQALPAGLELREPARR